MVVARPPRLALSCPFVSAMQVHLVSISSAALGSALVRGSCDGRAAALSLCCPLHFSLQVNLVSIRLMVWVGRAGSLSLNTRECS